MCRRVVTTFNIFCLLSIIQTGLVYGRNPFMFAHEQQPLQIVTHELELQGLSRCQGTETMLAIIADAHELFTVGLGDTINQWRVHTITKEYVMLVDQKGNEKKLAFKD